MRVCLKVEEGPECTNVFLVGRCASSFSLSINFKSKLQSCLLFFVFFLSSGWFCFCWLLVVGCWLLVVDVVGWLLVVARGC